MSKIRTHYDNLQVSRTASDAVIRAAYKSLSQLNHPDKHPDNRASFERRMKIINQAYQILSNPEERRKHDKWIAEQEAEYHKKVEAEARRQAEAARQPEAARQAEAASAGGSNVSTSWAEWKTTTSIPNLVYYQPKKRLWFLFLGGLGFVFLGILLIVVSPEFPGLLVTIVPFIGLASIWFFGAISLESLQHIFSPVPSLLADEEGIKVYGKEKLRWQNLLRVEIVEIQGYRYLAFIPRNPSEVRRVGFRKLLALVPGDWFGFAQGAMYVMEHDLNCPLEQVLHAIESRL